MYVPMNEETDVYLSAIISMLLSFCSLPCSAADCSLKRCIPAEILKYFPVYLYRTTRVVWVTSVAKQMCVTE